MSSWSRTPSPIPLHKNRCISFISPAISSEDECEQTNCTSRPWPIGGSFGGSQDTRDEIHSGIPPGLIVNVLVRVLSRTTVGGDAEFFDAEHQRVWTSTAGYTPSFRYTNLPKPCLLRRSWCYLSRPTRARERGGGGKEDDAYERKNGGRQDRIHEDDANCNSLGQEPDFEQDEYAEGRDSYTHDGPAPRKSVALISPTAINRQREGDRADHQNHPYCQKNPEEQKRVHCQHSDN